ncbi:unnamed protein product [Spirodela intermedia]|uniref:RING-type domain-containing protein n=1 Tax=Spirodela intermedia TaxID=51605 RepID=A0A7I8K963_SPIIN|nr:unnamed protein product [Spirodela intermedia]
MPDDDVGDSGGGGGDGDDGGGSLPPVPSSSSVKEEELQLEPEEKEKQLLESANVEQQEQNGEEGGDEEGVVPSQEDDAENGDSSSSSGDAEDDKTEYVLVELADIRREVQCPICLGIIRKTRTVMDCLHRFCRECIDRSMRLGNNECPACRTHCASRRSLRDDPNYDALIAALYPDIDKYEEEELALHEEELLRNKKIQAYITETYQRQSEALGRRRSSSKAAEAGFMRRSQRNFRSGRGHNGYPRGASRSSCRFTAAVANSDNEEEVADASEEGKYASSANEPSPDPGRQKRCRRWGPPRYSHSPARAPPGPDRIYDEPDEAELGQEALGASPGLVGSREVLVWGKNGVRSQTRHGGSGGSSGKSARGDRISKLVEYLHSLDEQDDEFDVHLKLVPAEEQRIQSVERPFLCCRPTLSIKQLSKFIALETAVEAEGIEILVEKKPPPSPAQGCREFQTVEAQESLGRLHQDCSSSSAPCDLVLAYRSRVQGEESASSPTVEGRPAGHYNFL